MKKLIPLLPGVLLFIAFLAAFEVGAGAAQPRLLVLTDIGGDPDDQQSLIRLMLYANEFEIEGLIASASGTPNELKERVTKPHLIREIVEAYGQVRDNLALHAQGYPPAPRLLERIKSGNPNRGLKAIGDGHDTEGSQWIISVADKPDPRPLNITIWGGQTDLAQALWRVRQDRGQAGLKQFISQLRVYDIGDQDRIHDWLFENFGDAFYVLAKSLPNRDKREGAYRGMYLGGDESLTARAWIDTHVRTGHGPLGALYPTKTWTAPNPHSTLKEGDTPSWFYFLPNGLSDPAHPEWGGWGGRFAPAQRGLYRDAKDTVGEVTDARATVWRWRPAFQNDFQARLDWCVKPFAQVNHPPKAVLNGDASRSVLRVKAKSGETLTLDASRSTDPDGDKLAFKWWIYREAGNYEKPIDVTDADRAVARVPLPADAAGKSLHVILEVTDSGVPALTSYRRAVIQLSE